MHQQSRLFIDSALKADRTKTVVVTHHLPHCRSIPARFKGDLLSAAYASDLSEVIEMGRPVLWIHGHTHDSCDYTVGDRPDGLGILRSWDARHGVAKLRISILRLTCSGISLTHQLNSLALIRKELWANNPDGLTGRWNWLRYCPYHDHGSAYRTALSSDRRCVRLGYRRNFGLDRGDYHPLRKLDRIRMYRNRVKQG